MLNQELQEKLTEKYLEEKGMIPFSNCCGSCLCNDFDDVDYKDYIFTSGLKLEGMNYREYVNEIYISYGEEHFDNLKDYQDMIEEYIDTIGASIKRIVWPKNSSTCVLVELTETLELEEEEEWED